VATTTTPHTHTPSPPSNRRPVSKHLPTQPGIGTDDPGADVVRVKVWGETAPIQWPIPTLVINLSADRLLPEPINR